jgi:hypothetical protein
VFSSLGIGNAEARQITQNTAANNKYECRHCSQKSRQRTAALGRLAYGVDWSFVDIFD